MQDKLKLNYPRRCENIFFRKKKNVEDERKERAWGWVICEDEPLNEKNRGNIRPKLPCHVLLVCDCVLINCVKMEDTSEPCCQSWWSALWFIHQIQGDKSNLSETWILLQTYVSDKMDTLHFSAFERLHIISLLLMPQLVDWTTVGEK